MSDTDEERILRALDPGDVVYIKFSRYNNTFKEIPDIHTMTEARKIKDTRKGMMVGIGILAREEIHPYNNITCVAVLALDALAPDLDEQEFNRKLSFAPNLYPGNIKFKN